MILFENNKKGVSLHRIRAFVYRLNRVRGGAVGSSSGS